MKISISLILSFLISYAGLGQDNFARITNLIGSHIEFNFNSIDKYQNGITYTDGTTFGITMFNEPPGPVLTGWHLDFQSNLAQPTIDGAGGNFLPLNTIQVIATNAVGLAPSPANIYNVAQDLTIGGNTLLTSTTIPTDGNTHQVNITYECGIANGNLLDAGAASDYYRVEIEFILIPDF